MSAPEKQDAPETKVRRPEPPRREERGEKSATPVLDFAHLDLRIEKVEERISPSETNVFDK